MYGEWDTGNGLFCCRRDHCVCYKEDCPDTPDLNCAEGARHEYTKPDACCKQEYQQCVCEGVETITDTKWIDSTDYTGEGST